MKSALEIHGVQCKREGVPHVREPLVWDTRLTVRVNLNCLMEELRYHSRYLPVGCYFDEAAVMVPNVEARDKFINTLLGNGWHEFNRAADLVHTSPISSRYSVEYTFLRHPGYSWRMEVMLLGQETMDGTYGFSPLHQALWRPNGVTPTWAEHAELPVPHLSFKPSPGMVSEMGAAKAVRRVLASMQDMGFLLVQGCQSTYGEFWYLQHVEARRSLYLKPRINTRDEAR